MRKLFSNPRWLSLFVVMALLVSALAGCGTSGSSSSASSGSLPQQSSSIPASQPQDTTSPAEVPAASYEENAEYLNVYFNVDAATQWDAASYSAALAAVAGDNAAAVEGELTALSAMQAAVISAAYDELAKSYPDEKVTERLALYGVEPSDDATMNAYIACGLDAKLFGAGQAKEAMADGSFTGEFAAELLMSVAEANGNTRNYLGYSNDPEMDARLEHMWSSFQMFDDAELTEIGRTAVEQQITTGYNLKSSVYSARFLPSLTLQYGHSDIKHAHQLMVLLNSEDIVAKVQLEPKVSVYQYLLDWGPVPDPSPTYEVRQFGDELYLAFAVEYDLQLEFASLEDMLRFDEVILTYAKKWEGNEDAVGLIYASWWQPLYSTTRDDMPEDAYYKIHDCVITNGDYSIHPFCLDEKFDETVEQLNALNPDFQVEAVTRYCNKAFHNYMTGDDFQ